MAITSLARPPVFEKDQSSYAWLDWFGQLHNYITSVGSFSWTIINFTGSDLVDIQTRNHNDLQNKQGGTTGQLFHLTSAQHTTLIGSISSGDSTIHFHSSDRSRSNHTGTQTMSTISDLPTLSSGTYTPTVVSSTNLDGSATFSAQYLRVGSSVTVSGLLAANATAAGAATLVISLPIASNFSSTTHCAGVAVADAVAGQSAAIRAETTADAAEVAWIAVNLAQQDMYYTYTYRIL